MKKVIKHIITLTINADSREELYDLEDSANWEVDKLKKQFQGWMEVECEIERVD
jgi:hypothetical protein